MKDKKKKMSIVLLSDKQISQIMNGKTINCGNILITRFNVDINYEPVDILDPRD